MGLLISVHRVQTTSMLYASNSIKLVKKFWAKQLKTMNCVQACEYKTEKNYCYKHFNIICRIQEVLLK